MRASDKDGTSFQRQWMKLHPLLGTILTDGWPHKDAPFNQHQPHHLAKIRIIISSSYWLKLWPHLRRPPTPMCPVAAMEAYTVYGMLWLFSPLGNTLPLQGWDGTHSQVLLLDLPTPDRAMWFDTAKFNAQFAH